MSLITRTELSGDVPTRVSKASRNNLSLPFDAACFLSTPLRSSESRSRREGFARALAQVVLAAKFTDLCPGLRLLHDAEDLVVVYLDMRRRNHLALHYEKIPLLGIARFRRDCQSEQIVLFIEDDTRGDIVAINKIQPEEPSQ